MGPQQTVTNPSRDTATAPNSPTLGEASWGSVVRVAVARGILASIATLFVWSVLPAALGWTPQMVLSGSMEPRIHTGDVIVTRPATPAAVTKSRVITVNDPDHPGRTRTHRVLRVEDDGTIVLKGDANAEPDSATFTYDDVVGVGVIRVPYIAKPVFWWSTGQRLPVAVVLLGLIICLACARTRQEPEEPRSNTPRPPDDDHPGGIGFLDRLFDPGDQRRPAPPMRPDHPTLTRLSVRPRRAAVHVTTALAVVVSAAFTGVATHAAFAARGNNASNAFSAATNFYPYRTAVLADSPYLFWRLDETAGTIVDDETVNNRNGTLVSSNHAWAQPGALPAEAAETSLRTTVATINGNTQVAAPTTFSVEAWIKTTSTTGGRIVGFGNATGSTASTTADRHLYMAPTGRVYFGVGNTKTAVASTASLNNNAWHHIVGTYTSGNGGLRLYVNGALQATGTATVQNYNGYWRAAAEQLTGWPGNPTDAYYDGNLQELAVYTTALTAARVTAHYNAGATP